MIATKKDGIMMKQEQDIATINEQLDIAKYETENIKNLI